MARRAQTTLNTPNHDHVRLAANTHIYIPLRCKLQDTQLEDHTQKELNDIHKGLNRQMDEILARQNRKNQTAIEELKKDFEEKHTAYAEKIVRRIIEG